MKNLNQIIADTLGIREEAVSEPSTIVKVSIADIRKMAIIHSKERRNLAYRLFEIRAGGVKSSLIEHIL